MRGTEQFGIYFMQINHGLRPSNEELKLIMDDWANNTIRSDSTKNIKSRQSEGLGRGWKRESIKHPSSKYEDTLPWIIAERISCRL